MPIKFACPKCKSVLKVADEMAGKKGKCKCGYALSIPLPSDSRSSKAKAGQSGAKKAGKAATKSAAVPSALGQVFDDLTDADFNRQSPMGKVYSVSETNDDAETLRKFEGEEVKEARAKAGDLNAKMISVALICILLGIGSIAFAVLCGIENAALKQVSDYLVEVKLSKSLAVTFFSVAAVFSLLGGIGMFLKKSWGWILGTAVIVFATVDRIVGFGLLVTSGFSQAKFFGGMIPLFLFIVLTTFVFSEDNRKIFRVRSKVLVIVAVLMGLGLVGAAFGTMAGTGVLGKAKTTAEG